MNSSYVLLVTTATFVLGLWQGLRVISFRRNANVPYPLPYAFPDSSSTEKSATNSVAKQDAEKNAYLFNCAQRAHANYLENHPTAVAALLIAGLKYPLATAGIGAFWCLNRWAYAIGYTRSDKERGSGRLIGKYWIIPHSALIGLSGWTGWSFLMG